MIMATEKKKGGRDPILYIGTYVFTWISGLIVFLVKKDDKNMRFHAMQAIMLGVVITAISIVGGYAYGALYSVGGILELILWVYGLYVGYSASKGEDIMMPVIGEYAKKYSK